jgi:hypothetical protein
VLRLIVCLRQATVQDWVLGYGKVDCLRHWEYVVLVGNGDGIDAGSAGAASPQNPSRQRKWRELNFVGTPQSHHRHHCWRVMILMVAARKAVAGITKGWMTTNAGRGEAAPKVLVQICNEHCESGVLLSQTYGHDVMNDRLQSCICDRVGDNPGKWERHPDCGRGLGS